MQSVGRAASSDGEHEVAEESPPELFRSGFDNPDDSCCAGAVVKSSKRR